MPTPPTLKIVFDEGDPKEFQFVTLSGEPELDQLQLETFTKGGADGVGWREVAMRAEEFELFATAGYLSHAELDLAYENLRKHAGKSCRVYDQFGRVTPSGSRRFLFLHTSKPNRKEVCAFVGGPYVNPPLRGAFKFRLQLII